MSTKGVVAGIVTAAVVCAGCAGGWYYYKNHVGKVSSSNEKVYVQRVAAVNTVGGAELYSNSYAGVIVAQKTVDVKYDQSKTIDEILVQEGDKVKKGDKLLTYNVESIQLQIDAAKLEVEGYQNTIENNKAQIAELEQEKNSVTGDAQVSYTTQILALQSDNARTEYEIKTKNVDIAKLENSLKNAFVVAPIDGTVKDLKDPADSQSGGMEGGMYGGMGDAADVIMKIAALGDYRVKGTFNEQNAAQIYQGAPMLLHSRVDDTVWHGTITEIDTNPQQNDNSNMMYYGGGMSDDSSSSKYTFYVEPESLEGFMLGQHLLLEPDLQSDSDVDKEGLWLYSNFVLWDGSRNYVWAKTARDTIEKRYVELGTVDDACGDCQILSGLSDDDYIAFPADYIEEGMHTTTNQSDKDIPDNAFEGQDDMFGGGMDGADEGMMFDEDGNPMFIDEGGNEIAFDADGNPIMPEEGMENEGKAESDAPADAEGDVPADAEGDAPADAEGDAPADAEGDAPADGE